MKTIVQAKGQVTLPLEARKEMGLEPGDEVSWVRDENGHWEVWTLDQLVEDLGFGTGQLRDWSRRAKKGYNPKGPQG